MTSVLGVSCHYHDAAAVLLVDGRLIAAAEEERFTRIKHDAHYPSQAIDFCLKGAGLSRGELDWVVFYERPWRKFHRIIWSAAAGGRRSQTAFYTSAQKYMEERLWIRRRLARDLRIPPKRVLLSEHHLSHAASAFFPSPFPEAATLTLDGVGEWATGTIGSGRFDERTTHLSLTHQTRFPHSLGLLYSAFTAYLGFEVNEGEYKVMGLAAHGRPRYTDELAKVARVTDDGSIELDLDYFRFQYDAGCPWSEKLERLLPLAPRAANSPVSDLSPLDQPYADLAASLQTFTEEAVTRAASHALKVSGLRHLCMAGGVALNGLANAQVLRVPGIAGLYIPPAPGDSGGALGAAAHVDATLGSKKRLAPLEHSYWGSQFSAGAMRQALSEAGLHYRECEDDKELTTDVAEYLAEGSIVGWFQGRAEFGPRALGNRSILADPRDPRMKDRINASIKFREQFRPFAPAIAEESVGDYVHEERLGADCTKFMLLILPLTAKGRDELPAVDHGGTARLQSVSPDTNPLFYGLLQAFAERSGTPALINTSFNLRGEPIVHTPDDAVSTFLRSDLDYLVMGPFIANK